MDTSRSQHRRSTHHDFVVGSDNALERRAAVLAVAAKTGVKCTNSFVVDLAYEEYCELREKGDEVDKSIFVGRFPDIKHSLIRRIEVHEYLEDYDFDGGRELKEIATGDLLFSNFQVIEKLGQGALGHVFLCEQSGVGNRQTVVKVAFQGAYEAETQGKLSHLNIMPVYSVHVDELTMRSGICMPFHGRSTLCDVMDLAWKDAGTPRDGELLKQAAIRWQQDEDRIEGSVKTADADRDYLDSVLRIGVELTSALEHSHSRGVRHDDLKPSNVLVGANGHAMLLDFNLSSREGEQGQCGGTLPYMSPEQIRRINSPRHEIDNRSDIFSLGILLYELLAGRRPFMDPSSVSSEDQANKHLEHLKTTNVVSMSDCNSEVDSELNDIVLRCLQFHPNDRYSDIATLGGLLAQYQANRNSHELMAQARRTKILRWTKVSLTGACLFLAATMGRSLVGGSDSRQQAPATVEARVQVPSAWVNQGPEFAEAWRLIKERRYDEAYAVLESTLDRHPGLTHACLAYVAALRTGDIGSIVRLHSAKSLEGGFENAAVWNNYGVYLANEEKRRAFDKAIELQPDAWPAYFNRAEQYSHQYAQFSRRQPTSHGAIPWVTMCQPYQAVSDIMRVRAEFPENGEVARLAAELFSYYARWDKSYREEFFDSLRLAHQTGNQPFLDAIPGNYRWVSDDPEYLEILELGKNAYFHTFSNLMDPLAD